MDQDDAATEPVAPRGAKFVVCVLTSLDGFYEGVSHDLSPMPIEDAFNSNNLDLIRLAGTLVFGSTWFEENWKHWSAVAADPSQNARDHEIARLVTTLDSLVVSDSMTIHPDAPWATTARVVSRAEAADEIARVKQRGHGDLLTFGSATTWNPLLEQGVVDELVILVGAALLGEGVKVYSGARAGLRLRGARVLPGSQLVQLRYDVSR